MICSLSLTCETVLKVESIELENILASWRARGYGREYLDP